MQMLSWVTITKTYLLYNFDPLKLHFYLVKLGFIALGEAVLTSTHNLCFEQKYEKYQKFYLKIFSFGGEIFNIFE